MEQGPSTAKLSVDVLHGVSETLLMPLWSRAVESARPDAILRDPKAQAIVSQLQYDFDKFRTRGVDPVGYCSRAVIFDRLVAEWLAEHPQGPVVEIGAGLDTRFERVDNGQVLWFDLDLPEVAAIRQHFFPEHPRRRLLACSMLDRHWVATVQRVTSGPVLLTAEGVFYFFRSEVLRQFFFDLAEAFPGGRLIFDAQSPWYLWYSRWRHPLRRSELVWSLGSVKRWVESTPGVRLVRWIGFGDSPYYDRHLLRFPLVFRLARKLFPAVRGAFKIVEVELIGPMAAKG